MPAPRTGPMRRICDVAADLGLSENAVRRMVTEARAEAEVPEFDMIRKLHGNAQRPAGVYITDLGLKALEAKLRRSTRQSEWQQVEDEYQRRMAIRQAHRDEVNRKAGIRMSSDYLSYHRITKGQSL